MVKAADAAVEAGFAVRFVSVDVADWAARLDGDLVRVRRWRWDRVRLRKAEHPLRSRWVSARHRAARAVAARVSGERLATSLAVLAFARTHSELVRAILAEPFDFVYGGTVGALAATAEAARRANRPFAIDLEDYHPGESSDADADLTHRLAASVLRYALDRPAFVTTASVPMAREYEAVFAINARVIHNVMPRSLSPGSFDVDRGPLKLYWFSQTVAAGRGLEEIVDGIALAGIEAELHLRGANGDAFVEQLRLKAHAHGARLEIHLHPPALADHMVDLCRQYAVGLALEQPDALNRDLCVTNKVLTYLSAGLAVLATSTQGHRFVAQNAPSAMACYDCGDTLALASALKRWNDDRPRLAAARRASWQAAEARFHWEHPLERGALVRALEEAVA
jgi:glycosyltransferase involved in cell wall biosynthesis